MRRRKQTTVMDEDFNKSELIDTQLIDKASLWILRIILNLGGHRKFIDKDNDFTDESVVAFLDLMQYGMMESEEYKRSEIIIIMKNQLSSLEQQKKFTASKILTKNIKQLSNLMSLNKYEEQILEFVIVMKQYELLSQAVGFLGNEVNSSQVKTAISVILNIAKKDVDAAFASNSKFSKSSLLTIDKRNLYSLDRKLDSISNIFLDNMLNLDEDIAMMIKDSVKMCEASELALGDYTHINKDIDILIPYLQHAINNKQTGVNILLYGLPGTGKTELAKVLSKELGTKLFEVSYADMDDAPLDGAERLKAYKSAQAILANQKTILMYDEAEDVFESSFSLFGPPQRQKDKAWINRVLETNTIPTLWITNNINSIDNAIIRRFDMSIELPIPPKSKREEIIKNYSNNLLDDKSIKQLAQNEDIAPAFISSAIKVLSALETNNAKEALTHMLNNTLKAQGYNELKKENNALPSLYNPAFINTTIDLKTLACGIKETLSARLCLYGAPGTGKSAFGKYIADVLDKPVLLKKGSDLISMYVGGTEKNIANAFKEAKEESAVLVFDEVDSFLSDRTHAKQSWEVTQVNEMLVQMENFEGVFIATTNLMDNLDPASLRRFDLKLEFGYLKQDQAWQMFNSYAEELKLAKPTEGFKSAINVLRHLTPGDFAAVARQNRFRPIANIKDFTARLQDEIKAKNVSGNKMGFL